MNARLRTVRALAVIVVVPCLAAAIEAQPVAAGSFQVTQVAAGLSSGARGLAVDRHGVVYVNDQPMSGSGPWTITAVHENGAMLGAVFTSTTAISQLATNPWDGLVYATVRVSVAPWATLYRLSATGATSITTLFIQNSGLTADASGRFYFWGTSSGAGSSTGLFRWDPAAPGPLVGIPTPGFTTSGQVLLQSLPGGDLLLAWGTTVSRLSNGVISAYHSEPAPIPNQTIAITALAPSPFSALGAGGLVAVREYTTLCFCGTSKAVFVDATGAPAGPPVISQAVSFPGGGVGGIAAGPGQELYWLTRTAVNHSLFRIRAVPAPNSAGSLLTSTSPGLVSLDLFGRPATSSAFVLGFMVQPLPANAAGFAPGLGVLDLDPFHPAYVNVFDGVGLLGPVLPSAVVPPAGPFHLDVPIPPGLTGLVLDLQALLLNPLAPNRLFDRSNLASVLLP